MADERTMITFRGTRHKAITNGGTGWQSACPQRYLLREQDQHRPARSDCKRCFPSSDASLGAAEGEQQQ